MLHHREMLKIKLSYEFGRKTEHKNLTVKTFHTNLQLYFN